MIRKKIIDNFEKWGESISNDELISLMSVQSDVATAVSRLLPRVDRKMLDKKEYEALDYLIHYIGLVNMVLAGLEP
jgi:hypothetical protein